MLREAGLHTPENGSDLSDIDDSDCIYDERLAKPQSQQEHFDATLDKRLKKALKHEKSPIKDDSSLNESSPIITREHMKEVFEEYADHLAPFAGMTELSESETDHPVP